MAAGPKRPPLTEYDEALELVLSRVGRLGVVSAPLSEALGRTLARGVSADRDQPPFDRSAMDGFAVRSVEAEAGRWFAVSGSVPAGAPPARFEAPMPAGTVQRIATGAPLPCGADATVPIERAEVVSEGEGERVRFEVGEVRPWANIHRRGADAAAGATVLRGGTRLGAHQIGLCAMFGADPVSVVDLPRVRLLTTGDEVRPASTPTGELQPQQIRNSNGPMLEGLLGAMGVALRGQVHVPDEPEQTLAAAREAFSSSHLVLTVGGVSVGQRDLLPWAWQRLGLETVVHGVAIQPGKPLLVAAADGKLVLGLPGNPVSVWTIAQLFLRPVLRKMAGLGSEPVWRELELAAPVKAKASRLVFRAARIEGDGRARVLGWQGSGDLVHLAEGEGFVRLPRVDGAVSAGETVGFLSWAGGLGG